MRKAELVVYGLEPAIEGRLEKWSQGQGLWFRGVAKPEGVLSLLRHGSRGAVLMRIGRDLQDELETLALAARGFEVPVLVLGDFAHPELEGTVYDLGAAGAIFGVGEADQLLEWLTAIFAPTRRE